MCVGGGGYVCGGNSRFACSNMIPVLFSSLPIFSLLLLSSVSTLSEIPSGVKMAQLISVIDTDFDRLLANSLNCSKN